MQYSVITASEGCSTEMVNIILYNPMSKMKLKTFAKRHVIKQVLIVSYFLNLPVELSTQPLV